MAKVPKWVWLLLLGAVLMLPMLGSFGLWDPAEIRQADVAREVAQQGSFADVTVKGRYAPRSVLYVWLVAVGFKAFGVNELAGRLPLAICGLLALLLAYRVGRKLVSERAGLAAGFVLATTPVFLFQARQLASDVPFYLAILAAVGGLAAFLAPADGQRERRDLVIGSLGLVGAALSHGVLLGVGLPLLSLGLALVFGRRYFADAKAEEKPAVDHDDDKAADDKAADDDKATDDELVPPTKMVPEASTLLPPLGEAWRPLAVGLVAAAGLLAVLLASIKQGKVLLLGGVYHKVALPPTFDQALRDIGFGLFPWFAVAPLALWAFVAAQRDDGKGDGTAFAKLVLLLAVFFGYLADVLWPGFFGPLRFPALPLLLLAVGFWATEVYDRGEVRPFWGVVAAGLVLVVHQDFFMEPQSLAFAHLTEAARYPADLKIKVPIRVFGLALAALFFLTLSGPPRPITLVFRTRFIGGPLNWLAHQLDRIGGGLRALGGEGGRNYYLASAAGALLFAGWCSLWLTPQLSYHMSNKALFETYHHCAQKGERLAQYRVSGRGAAYYNNGQVDEIRSQADLFTKLRAPARVFVLLPSSYLGSIDQAARQQRVNYHVLDDRNSHYLIISNKLSGTCTEDKNPLRKLVLRTRPTPQKKAYVNWENKLELIGYDLPDSVTRGGSFEIKLYFKVLQRLQPNYKIFIHFDKPASRFHGDHAPLGGKYPTQYWLPGDYIVDPHKIDIPILTTPSGNYSIMMGFWQGSRRYKIVKGPNDGVNRARIGTLRVR